VDLRVSRLNRAAPLRPQLGDAVEERGVLRASATESRADFVEVLDDETKIVHGARLVSTTRHARALVNRSGRAALVATTPRIRARARRVLRSPPSR
jgi:hypothetical protein